MAYPGGKNGSGVYQQIINQIPPHDVYLELFFGSGTIYRLKRLAGKNIGVENDTSAIASFAKEYPAERRQIDLLCVDTIDFLDKHFDWIHMSFKRVFIYADPPYLFETRKSRSYYPNEFGTRVEHQELIKRLKAMPKNVKVALSGYPNNLYDELLPNWRTITFTARTRGNTNATEKLWMNYPEPSELHDYRYLGENFRERERIKRKKARWEARLLKMAILERRAILSVIDELREAGSL